MLLQSALKIFGMKRKLEIIHFIKQCVSCLLGVLQDWPRKTDSNVGITSGAIRNRWNTGHGIKLAGREKKSDKSMLIHCEAQKIELSQNRLEKERVHQ